MASRCFKPGGDLCQSKRFDEAIAVLKKLLELNPHAEDAEAMLTEIEKEKKKRK